MTRLTAVKPPQQPTPEPFVKLKEIVALTSLGEDFWYAHKSEVPHFKTPKFLLFRVSEVFRWLENFRQGQGEHG